MISSRTPEGWFHRCGVCDQEVRVEPSAYPTNDAPCPHCGCLGWFEPPAEFRLRGDELDTALPEWYAAGRPRQVVIDFEGVRDIRSHHLGTLILLSRMVQSLGGGLRLFGLSDDVRRVFGTTHLDQLLNLDDPEVDPYDPDDD